MRKLLLIVATIAMFYAVPAQSKGCPDPNTDYGRGFYGAVVEILREGLSLRNEFCVKNKAGERSKKERRQMLMCMAGYYDALDNEGFAFKCASEQPML